MFLTICPICRLFFSEEDKVNSTPCGHVFHASCINEWLNNAVICPVCHSEMKGRSLIRLFFDNHNIQSGSVGVDVRNRDGVFLRFLVRPPDTVGSLIKELLDSHEVERVADIRLRGVSLLFGPCTDSASLLIRDCGLREGDELQLVESPVRQCLAVWHSGGARRTLRLDLLDGEGLPLLRRRVGEEAGLGAAEVPLLYLSGGVVVPGGEEPQRRYTRVFDPATRLEQLADLRSATPGGVKKSMLTLYTRTVLDDATALPDAGALALVVKAVPRVQFWKLRADAGAPFLRLRDSLACFRARSVAGWLCAFAAGPPGEPAQLFLQCFGNCCVDPRSGAAFDGPDALRARWPSCEPLPCIVFVEEGVTFPKFAVRANQSLLLWTPQGEEVAFEAGALRFRDQFRPPRTNVWVAGRALIDELKAYFASEKRTRWDICR